MHYFMLIIPAIMWGTLGAFVRQISMTSTQIALIRTLLAGATLLAIYFLGKQRLTRERFLKNGWKLALAGCAMAFNWIALFEAYKLTSVSVATVVYYMAPAIVIAASPYLFHEKLTRSKLIGAAAALLGMVFISFTDGAGIVSADGVAMAFGGAILYATVILCNKSIQDMSGFETTLVEFAFAILVLLPYSLCLTGETWQMPDATGVFCLLVIGIFHTGLCYWMYFSAVQRVSAQTTAICSFADPFSALFVSFFVLGESMSAIQIWGAVLIIGGAMVAELWPSGSK